MPRPYTGFPANIVGAFPCVRPISCGSTVYFAGEGGCAPAAVKIQLARAEEVLGGGGEIRSMDVE